MYPGTIMNWHDQSEIDVQSSTNVIINNAPLFLQVFSSDKGPEDLRIVSGDDFDSLKQELAENGFDAKEI